MMDLFLSFFQTLNLTTLIFFALFLSAAAIGVIRLRKMKGRLEAKQEELNFFLDHTEDGIAIMEELTFNYANKRAYEIMGLENTEDVSKNFSDYIFPDDLPVALDGLKKNMLHSSRETGFNVRLLKPGQGIVWVHLRSFPVIWEGVPASFTFIRDITAQKMVEQDLQQAQRMEAIGILSGGIAHDFNNILTTIIGNAELALMDIKGETHGKKEFEQIRESGHRARDLVRQILTVSREYTAETQPLYLSPIIKEAVKLLRSTLPKNIKIVTQIDKQVSLVRADSVRIYQAFMNLCTNAKHAMENKDSGCLEVELKNFVLYSPLKIRANDLSPGSYVKLSVADTGMGIDPGFADKIFEPYFTTKNKGNGSGLGLATSLGIIKQFNGHITFDSEPGKGSCFTIFLPAVEPEKSKEKALETTVPVQGRGNILFVDDEMEITVMAKKMLTLLGFSVMTTQSGKQALENFSKDPEFFNLLITDLAMPEMTGIKLAKEVMQIRPGFPVIICTGHSDTFDERAAKEAGIVEYIKKPYNLTELGALVTRHMKNFIAA